MNLPDKKQSVNDKITDKEKQKISSHFPPQELPLHLILKSDLRINKKKRKNVFLGLSSHYIMCFDYIKKKKLYLYAQLHISSVNLIASNGREFCVIQTDKTRLTVSSPECLDFARLLYRNFVLSCNISDIKNMIDVRYVNRNEFPEIDTRLSLSQKFQYAYFSNCSLLGQKYNHEIVRCFHNFILSRHTLLDLSQLPINIFEANYDVVSSVFKSLNSLNIITGVCSIGVDGPEILKSFAPFLGMNSNIQIIHFEDCGITDGLEEVLENLKKNPVLNVVYWNLSQNKFTNPNPLIDIFSFSQKKVLYVNFNGCRLSARFLESLFTSFIENKNMYELRHLHLSGSDFQDNNALVSFRQFLGRCSKEGGIKLETLDIGSIKSYVCRILEVTHEVQIPLKRLILSNSRINSVDMEQLLFVIKSTKTLSVLDVSNTSISPEDVASIIESFSKNDDIDRVTLYINCLNLNGEKLLPLFNSFHINGFTKWNGLYMDSNKMSASDLKELSALLVKMENLEELSLSDNFDSSMEFVSRILLDLLLIPRLRKLCLSGSKEHCLRSALFPFLEHVCEKNTIKYLDISNNDLGDIGLNLIKHIICTSESIEEIFFDNNGINTFEHISAVAEAVKLNENIITFGFPVSDAKNIIDITDHKDHMMLINKLGYIRHRLHQRTIVNRTRKGLAMALPFQTFPFVVELVNEISHDTYRKNSSENLRVHSLTCEIFGIPLPFQNAGDPCPKDGDKHVESVDISHLDVYGTKQLGLYYREQKTDYKTGLFGTLNFGVKIDLTDSIFKEQNYSSYIERMILEEKDCFTTDDMSDIHIKPQTVPVTRDNLSFDSVGDDNVVKTGGSHSILKHNSSFSDLKEGGQVPPPGLRTPPPPLKKRASGYRLVNEECIKNGPSTEEPVSLDMNDESYAKNCLTPGYSDMSHQSNIPSATDLSFHGHTKTSSNNTANMNETKSSDRLIDDLSHDMTTKEDSNHTDNIKCHQIPVNNLNNGSGLKAGSPDSRHSNAPTSEHTKIKPPPIKKCLIIPSQDSSSKKSSNSDNNGFVSHNNSQTSPNGLDKSQQSSSDVLNLTSNEKLSSRIEQLECPNSNSAQSHSENGTELSNIKSLENLSHSFIDFDSELIHSLSDEEEERKYSSLKKLKLLRRNNSSDEQVQIKHEGITEDLPEPPVQKHDYEWEKSERMIYPLQDLISFANDVVNETSDPSRQRKKA